MRTLRTYFVILLSLPLLSYAQNLLESNDAWQMAGPGSFEWNDDTITATGGMGLLWYSSKSVGDFHLSLDYKAETDAMNSGVFIRFPDPGNDPWVAVKQGLEVQIQGKATGAIFSFQDPNADALAKARKPGDWNRMEILGQGKRITVKLNGTEVNRYVSPRRLRGYIGVQNHDPKSPVQFRNIVLKDAAPLPRSAPERQRPGSAFYHKMDLGPVFTGTFLTKPRGDVLALKGLAVGLTPYEEATILYDTETLAAISAWPGFVLPSGTPWSGAHGDANTPTTPAGARLWNNSSRGLGWAKDSSFDDPRPDVHGPLPRDHARFLGHYRSNGKTLLQYTVGDTQIEEHPTAVYHTDELAVVRHFQIAPHKEALHHKILDTLPEGLTLSDDGHRTQLPRQARAKTLQLDPTTINVVIDRANDDWNLAATDLGKSPLKPSFRWIDSEFLSRPHPLAGAKGQTLPRLSDGLLPRNNDDTGRCSWLDGKGRFRVITDLGTSTDLARINTLSWHRSDRSPQKFVLYGANTERPPGMKSKAPLNAGWTELASIDTRGLGQGGQHLSSVTGALGTWRHLMWDVHSGNPHGCFFAEIDIWTTADELSELKIPAHKAEAPPAGFALIDAPKNLRLDLKDEQLILTIPPSDTPTRFALAASANPDAFDHLSSDIDFAALKTGGTSQWPETVNATGTLSESTETYVTDTIGIPTENPYNSRIRFGGFDFFKNGTSGAACTWNGDVWRFDATDNTMTNVTWQRIANGLFQTLGLRIVDETIHVLGRDGITRLHDLNGDQEIDHYDVFNHDVVITQNFHEFAFDLQTDADGNFYFSKGAPVRAGGRGFEKIVEHHGIVAKVSADGSTFETIATGLRAPGGVGVGPNGEITTGENEGTYVPRCKITWSPNGTYYGVIDTAQLDPVPQLKDGYALPLCWLPYFVDNSSGSQVWVPGNDDRWGKQHAGHMLHLSYGKCALYRVVHETIDGTTPVTQGGVYRIPMRLSSSAMRARFNPADGQLYLIGFKGWQTTAARECGFHRLRFTGTEGTLPTALEAKQNGMLIRFSDPIDPASAADPGNYSIRKWDYVWGPQYGSGRFSISRPDLAQRAKALAAPSKSYSKTDRVAIRSVSVLDGGNAVFLECVDMTPAMQMEIQCRLTSGNKQPLAFDFYNTVHKLGPEHPRAADATVVEITDTNATDPGLLLTFNNNQDARVASRPALYVPAKTRATALVNPGPFNAKWTGVLALDKRQTVAFTIEGNGNAELFIDNKKIDFGTPITIDAGQAFQLNYQSPKSGPAQIKLLWESDDFITEPVPPVFVHEPTDLLESKTTARDNFQDIRLSRGHAEYALEIIRKQDCRSCHSPGSKAPNLDLAGAKLTTEWMTNFFQGNTPKPRPWAPHCGHGDLADPAALALGLACLHGNGPSQATSPESDKAKATIGEQLTGLTGYACNTCHAIGKKPAIQVFEGAGPNLDQMRHRLRPDYYHRWMHNPQRIWPGTIMPKYTIDKDKTARADILEGDAKKQFEAMWEYLRGR